MTSLSASFAFVFTSTFCRFGGTPANGFVRSCFCRSGLCLRSSPTKSFSVLEPVTVTSAVPSPDSTLSFTLWQSSGWQAAACPLEVVDGPGREAEVTSELPGMLVMLPVVAWMEEFACLGDWGPQGFLPCDAQGSLAGEVLHVLVDMVAIGSSGDWGPPRVRP